MTVLISGKHFASRVLGACLALLALLTVGLALWAADADAKTIYACAQKQGSTAHRAKAAMRLVRQSVPCLPWERGPEGPAGPVDEQGPAGEPGPEGPPGAGGIGGVLVVTAHGGEGEPADAICPKEASLAIGGGGSSKTGAACSRPRRR